jgi:hypothetical protein
MVVHEAPSNAQTLLFISRRPQHSCVPHEIGENTWHWHCCITTIVLPRINTPCFYYHRVFK